MKSNKELILDHIETTVSNFVYYDRRNCEELPQGALEKAVENGEISVEDMVEHFKSLLKSSLPSCGENSSSESLNNP